MYHNLKVLRGAMFNRLLYQYKSRLVEHSLSDVYISSTTKSPFIQVISSRNAIKDLLTQAMEDNVTNSTSSKDPASFLSSIIGAPVTVKLNSGVVYKGELQSVDGYMNIALEKCQEFVNGQLRRNYGDAFVRGNNVLYIST